jgi:hypothetical protein
MCETHCSLCNIAGTFRDPLLWVDDEARKERPRFSGS